MKFNEILEKMKAIHDAKNHDYSGGSEFGNFKESERIDVPAWKGAFIRLQDKYSRACNLIKNGEENRKVLDEKLEDTLLDLANYAVIVLSLLLKETPRIPKIILKPGDKVKVKSFETLKRQYGFTDGSGITIKTPGRFAFVSGMYKFCDKTVTIVKVLDDDNLYFTIKEDEGVWTWSKFMFDFECEDKEEEQEEQEDDENNKRNYVNFGKLKEDYEELRKKINIKKRGGEEENDR